MQPRFWSSSALLVWCAGVVLMPGRAGAQTLPSGARLRDAMGATEWGTKNDTGPAGNQFTPWEPFATVANRESSIMEVASYPKWSLWPAPTTYDTTRLNSWVDWGKTHGKQVMVHMLVGANLYEPDWLVNGTWTNQQLLDMMQGMEQGVINSAGNNTRVDYWNVVNEAFAGSDPNSGTYRLDSDCKWNQLGFEADASGLSGADAINTSHPIYIRRALEFARGATAKRLELRENTMEMETTTTRSKAFFQLVNHLLNTGAPLDAVGFQCHLYGYTNAAARWNPFKDNVRRYKALGLEVYVDELDIGPAKGGSYDGAALHDCYYGFIRACREVGVDVICTWGLSDASSWRPAEKPLHFDANYDPKDAYYGMQSAINDTRAFMIRAQGMVGGEKIELRIDNAVVADWYLSKNLTEYCWTGVGSLSNGRNVKVAYVNDGTVNGKDKNARIDRVLINGVPYEGEYQAINTGNTTGSNKDWIYSNGYIDFGTVIFGGS